MQNIKPNDLVRVISIPDAAYKHGVRPGLIGTIVMWVPSSGIMFDPTATYWEVSFPDIGTRVVNERVLRKIGGDDGRKVGRWDYCVFNAPKRHAELERKQSVMENR